MSESLTQLDLAQCAREPIRVPGAIQPHGWMVALDANTRALVAYSANWSRLLGESADLPQRIEDVFAHLDFEVADLSRNDGSSSLGHLRVAGRALHASAHLRDGLLNVELEAQPEESGSRSPIYSLTRQLLPRMQSAQTVEALCKLAAQAIKQLTGFGRSLVYSFDSDGHGAVLAEEIDAGYDSYLGHHFPGSDIPPQARELYKVNRFRLIADATYTPVPVHVVDPAWHDRPLDMSLLQLRSVSPVHLEYMRNMGTLASSSVSIIVRGELWGLISVHDHAPRRLDYATRMACEHLGQLLSLQIEAKEDNARISQEAELRQLTLALVAHLADSDATLQRLVDHPGLLLRIARAGGAAVVLNDQCWTVGDVPDEASLHLLVDWLAPRTTHTFHTARLPEQCPPLAAHTAIASGLLAISISQVHRQYILWFRPEVVQEVQWAGDPRKNVDVHGDGRLHPRRSFATWREEVRGRSLDWSAGELGAALELRQALIGIVLRRAEELAEVAGELGRVNKELEAFSYTVSHDLRAPMRHIAGYVDLVLDGEQLGERSKRYLAHVKDAAAYAGQLVDALLEFSRMGRSALRRVDVKLATLVEDLVREFDAPQPGRIRWHVEGPFATLWGDALLLQVAVRNLVGNAVKYSRKCETPEITLRAVSTPEGDGLSVSDNGVGFEMKYANKLFGVFQRLHQVEEFEGTGIGLASVRRIVERHGGTVSAEGAPGRGATFTLLLPRRETLLSPSPPR
ncbi:ATP-binding protein [Rhizobacter sp. J219]|uniref:ATP-binding protein n=1 Tax=Rhizobacter sp. J219 TaxID=2898430 RepID=UPI002150A6FE|nr:ATP-binding protein [Rhizobacter sp. J219]MCR5883893.1 ATP-binding protein [Rhizobacter sp. J219]